MHGDGARARALEQFPLAAMSADILIITSLVLPLPALLVAAGLHQHSKTLLCAAAFVAFIWSSVWLFWRPSRFEVTEAGLDLIWPLRRWHIPAREISGIERLSRSDFARAFPRALRLGAGGLWGGFGWLLTANGKVSMYISRTDDLILIRRGDERPVLVTPANPQRFVDALRRAGPRQGSAS